MNDPKRDRMMIERELDAAVDAAYPDDPRYGHGPTFDVVLLRYEPGLDDYGLWDDEIDSPYNDYAEDTW